MLYTQTKFIAVFAAGLVLGAMAGEPDLVDEIRRDFKMGLFARQGPQTLQEGPDDLNIFAGALGGVPATPITRSNIPEQPYMINGDPAPNFDTAVNKACDDQKNNCAGLANGAKKGVFSVGNCDSQRDECTSFLKASATQTAFLSKTTLPGNDEFDFFCEN